MATVPERLATLEQGSREQNRRLEAIEGSLEDLKDLVRMANAAVERVNAQFSADMTSNHQANQASIGSLAADVAELKPVVMQHEKERQRGKGAKALLAAISAGIGAAASAIANFWK